MSAGDVAGADGDLRGLTVLVGDSQTLFAQALGRALARRCGLEVVEPYPRSGVDAAQAGVVLRPDVAVLDLWLEGVTAPAATRTILAKSPGTRVVVLGWFHGAVDIGQVLDAGAAGFVSKALGVGAVVGTIRRVVAGERVVADPNYAVATTASDDADEGGTGPSSFTPRELEVLRLLGAGMPVEDITARLDITLKTARTHLARILAKTGAHSQLQAVAVARERGLLV